MVIRVVTFARATLGMVCHSGSLPANCCTHVRCYSCDLGLVFSYSQYNFLHELIMTSISTNSALKPVSAPSSLLCFQTFGMLSQYASHLFHCDFIHITPCEFSIVLNRARSRLLLASSIVITVDET